MANGTASYTGGGSMSDDSVAYLWVAAYGALETAAAFTWDPALVPSQR